MTESLQFAVRRHVGFCIYCGGRPVSDEHHLPQWLGGMDELEKGSCGACQKTINDQIENPMARGPFWSARLYMGFKATRKQKSACALQLLLANGNVQTVSITDDRNPGLLTMMSLQDPAILTQANPKARIGKYTATVIVHVFNEERRKQFALDHPSPHFSTGTLNTIAFARLLAKIAHGMALHSFGPCFKPLLREFILKGDIDQADFFVGGAGTEPLEADPLGPHHVALDATEIRGQVYLMCRLRLFANQHMPTYRVAVGILSHGLADQELARAWDVGDIADFRKAWRSPP